MTLKILAKTVEQIETFKAELIKLFEIHDLGEIKDFLGANIIRDRGNRVLYMRNTPKIDEYVEAFELGGATKAAPTPMSPDFVQTIK
jgi:hypothetical protein